MATNCLIGVTHGENFKVVYCHFDGYLSGVGATLLKHYNSSKANHLVALGNISYLAEQIEIPASNPEHNFDNPAPGVNVFYGRDRDEKQQEFKTFCCEAEFNMYAAQFDHTYIMHNGEWYYIPENKKFKQRQLLKEAIV